MNMVHDFQTLYEKYLNQVISEIQQFSSNEQLWQTVPGVINTGGNLALHLAGNLQTFIGAVLGNSGYVRNRDAEFATKGLSIQEVCQLLDAAKAEVLSALEKITDAHLQTAYPIDKFGAEKTTGYVLLYLLGHLNYHLGQINYIRRILSQSTNR